jgi:hypothetical protein
LDKKIIFKTGTFLQQTNFLLLKEFNNCIFFLFFENSGFRQEVEPPTQFQKSDKTIVLKATVKPMPRKDKICAFFSQCPQGKICGFFVANALQGGNVWAFFNQCPAGKNFGENDLRFGFIIEKKISQRK